jgi:uncharacterized membrane protein AbrB (regulator of aidB expression)
MKKGLKTTEFYVTVITVLLAYFADKIGIQQDETAQLASAIGAGVTAVVYIFSRTKVKARSVAVGDQVTYSPDRKGGDNG